ncbi:MAG TPA: small multi-drug export protein [Candidatus Thermoplasmatota archaeon]|nr:small multi-drug export protein [Candidatus Thermoplasmatota archaeon]
MIQEAVVSLLDGLPPWLSVLLLAAVPVVELRGSIPLGLLYYKMPLHEVVFLSIVGNLLPVYFLLRFLGPVERFLRRWKFWDAFFTKLFDRTVRKLDQQIKRYEAYALTIFVGIPLPVTGAWTGTAAAHAFGLNLRTSFTAIAFGVVMAAAIVTAIVVSGQALWLLA